MNTAPNLTQDDPGASDFAQHPQRAEPEDGWLWMSHPLRNGGNPIPVHIYTIDGVKCFRPFSEFAVDFGWAERNAEWSICATPAIAAEDAHSDWQHLSADLTRAKNLIVRLWNAHPSTRPMIEGATGRWFVWGVNQDATIATQASTPPSSVGTPPNSTGGANE